jgi:hypothetical protein
MVRTRPLGGLGADIESGGNPLRQTAATVAGGHLPGVQLLENGQILGGQPGTLRLVGKKLLFQPVGGPLPVAHPPNIRSPWDRFKSFEPGSADFFVNLRERCLGELSLLDVVE